jgi:hypothetical protein
VTVGSSTRPQGQLAIGTIASTSGGLPASFTSTLSGQPQPTLVTLAGRQYYRLIDSGLSGGASGVAAYVRSTGGRTVVAVCHASAQSFAGLCERVLATLTVTPLAKLPPVLSPTYATGLNTILASLTSTRSHDLAQLASARTAAAQAKAAAALADLHRKAANAVLGLPAGAASAANTALGNALGRMAAGYRDLARAAASKSTSAYAAAQAEITRANGSVAAALAELKRLGYRVA